jgi:hypothetical protein
MSSTSDIANKHEELRRRGLDLGPKDGGELDAGSGGREQRFRNGSIFWHANTGAHEVHGGILALYRREGGPGPNPRTGRRHFGYPISDEERTFCGRAPASRFEFGDILFVGGTGGVAVTNEFHDAWKASGADMGALMLPLTMPIDVAGGEAIFCERGCLWRSAATGGEVIRAEFDPPPIARPRLLDVGPDTVSFPGFVTWRLPVPVHVALVRAGREAALMEVFSQRLFFRSVVEAGQEPRFVPMRMTDFERRQSGNEVRIALDAEVASKPGAGPALASRTLYDLALSVPGRGTLAVAPHAYYTRKGWSDFWFIHATDLHVAKRPDRIARRLERLAASDSEMRAARAAFVNFNDSFRDMVRYANHLHEVGALDMIIATGDLVDYAFEHEDLAGGHKGGNYAFFEDLVAGRVRTPSGEPGEALRVPIFGVFGNHDYRLEPYELLFELDVPGPFNKTVPQHSSHNLTRDEANKVQGRIVSVSIDKGHRMLRPDFNNARGDYNYSIRRVCPLGSYVIDAGANRFVMVDSGHDAGVPPSVGGSALAALLIQHLTGDLSEDTSNLVGGGPNLIGYRRSDVDLVRGALADTVDRGACIVGVHAPPFNIAKQQFAHFIRESERPGTSERELAALVLRLHGSSVLNNFGFLIPNPQQAIAVIEGKSDSTLPDSIWDRIVAIARDALDHDRWMETGNAHFMREDTDELLDAGVTRGRNRQFLEVCAGRGVARKMDMILCGHDHDRVEYRFEWNGRDQELRFYHDFYLETPPVYYRTKEAGREGPVHLNVEPGADPAGPVGSVRDNRFDPPREFLRRDVPPYDEPLVGSGNARDWWNRHGPLVVETASLGPIDRFQRPRPGRQPDETFSGFRVFRIRDSVVTAGHYVTLTALRANDFTMPFDPPAKPQKPFLGNVGGGGGVFAPLDAERDDTGPDVFA